MTSNRDRDNIVQFPGKKDSQRNEMLERALKVPRPAGLPDAERMAAFGRKEAKHRFKELFDKL